MATTIGFVTQLHTDGLATVVAEKGQGCGSCSAAMQCHGGRNAHSVPTTALNQAGANVGDRVTLSVPSGTLLSRLAVLYLVPVAGMLIGAFISAPVGNGIQATGDGRSILGGLAGFIIGFVLSVLISRIWSAHRPVLPVISRIVNNAPKTVSPAAPRDCACH